MKLKTISDLCREVGVTRKALRVYKNKGLLEPYNIVGDNEENETWKYNDDAVEKLQLIKIFRELDYSLDKIKNLFDMTDVDVQLELDEMNNKLISKMKRMEAYICFIIDWKARNALPLNTYEVLNRFSDYSFLQGKNGYQVLDDMINFSGYIVELYRTGDEGILLYSEKNRRMLEQDRILFYQQLALALLYEENPSSEQIYEFARQAVIYLKELVMIISDEYYYRFYESKTESELVALMYDKIKCSYSKQDPKMILDRSLSNRIVDNCLKALRAYGESCCTEGENFDQLLLQFRKEE